MAVKFTVSCPVEVLRNSGHENFENEMVLNLRNLCHLWIEISESSQFLKSIRRCRRWALIDGGLVHRFLPSGGFRQLMTREL